MNFPLRCKTITDMTRRIRVRHGKKSDSERNRSVSQREMPSKKRVRLNRENWRRKGKPLASCLRLIRPKRRWAMRIHSIALASRHDWKRGV